MGLFEIFKKKSESEVKPTCDELYPHEVQAIAEKRVEVIMAGFLEKNPEPDKDTSYEQHLQSGGRDCDSLVGSVIKSKISKTGCYLYIM